MDQALNLITGGSAVDYVPFSADTYSVLAAAVAEGDMVVVGVATGPGGKGGWTTLSSGGQVDMNHSYVAYPSGNQILLWNPWGGIWDVPPTTLDPLALPDPTVLPTISPNDFGTTNSPFSLVTVQTLL